MSAWVSPNSSLTQQPTRGPGGCWASANSSLTRTTSGRPTGEAAQAQVTRVSRHLSRGCLYGSSWALAVPVRVLQGCGLLPSCLGLEPRPLFHQGIFQTSIAMVRSGQSPGIKPEDTVLPHSTLSRFSPCRAGHQLTLVYPLLILCTDRGRAGGGGQSQEGQGGTDVPGLPAGRAGQSEAFPGGLLLLFDFLTPVITNDPGCPHSPRYPGSTT